MSSLIWLLFGFAGFATYEATKYKGIDRILWGILGVLFGMFALVLVASEK